MKSKIRYPYLPEGRIIDYVYSFNAFMILAKEFARIHSLDKVMPGAALVVKDNRILGIAANGSDYHEKHGCQRIILGCKTGEGYELCEGCHPKNHSESKAIQAAIAEGYNPGGGADLHLWGHWWCCKPCWDAIIGAGIGKVVLLESSEILFNKEHPNNVVGRQFE